MSTGTCLMFQQQRGVHFENDLADKARNVQSDTSHRERAGPLWHAVRRACLSENLVGKRGSFRHFMSMRRRTDPLTWTALLASKPGSNLAFANAWYPCDLEISLKIERFSWRQLSFRRARYACKSNFIPARDGHELRWQR